MDASAITKALNDHWLTLLDGYYDFIADSYLKHLSETYDKPLEELKEKTQHLKKKILNDAHTALDKTTEIKKDARKTKQKTVNTSSNSSYDSMTHPELAKLCKERGLQVKRKKQDMIDNLIQSDGPQGSKDSESVDNNKSPPSVPPSGELAEEVIDE